MGPRDTLTGMARVLFTSCPAYGHVLPMLPLMRAAERAGNDVRVATGPDLLGPLSSRGLDVRAVGPTWDGLVVRARGGVVGSGPAR